MKCIMIIRKLNDVSIYIKIGEFSEYLYQMMQSGEHNKMKRQSIKSLIEQGQIDQITNHFADLIIFVEQMELSIENLQLILKLVSFYGLAIAIFFKPFYAKMQKDADFVNLNKKKIKKILGHIKRITCGRPIEQLKFLECVAEPKINVNSIELEQNEKKFLQAIEEVSKVRRQIKSIKDLNELKKHISLYPDSIEKIKMKYQILQTDYLSIERYGLSKEEISQLFTNFTMNESSKLQQSVLSNSNYYAQFYSSNNLSLLQESQKNLNAALLPIEEPKIANNSCSSEDLNQSLCCRAFFNDQQILNQAEDLRKSFLQQSFPFKREFSDTLAMVICSFLNQEGGTLYIGIGILQDYQNCKVVGIQLSEGQRQSVIRTIRLACQQIQPDIIAQKMYYIDFIPIKKFNQFLVGRYVIKISVKYGIRSQVYSFREKNKDYFPFRRASTIDFIEGRDLMQKTKSRFDCPAPVPLPLHDYPCRKPSIGESLNRYYKDPMFYEKTQTILTEKKKEPSSKFYYYSEETKQRKPQKQQKYVSEFKAQIGGQDTIMKKKKQVANLTGTLQNKGKDNNQGQDVKIGYFYLRNISMKNIRILLEKNSMEGSTSVSQSDKGGILLTVRQTKAIEKMRKMLQKLEKKYFEEYLVKFEELSTELEVSNLKKALMEIKQMRSNCEYKIKGENVLKFKFYKDSLRVFLTLSEKGLHAKFQTSNLS